MLCTTTLPLLDFFKISKSVLDTCDNLIFFKGLLQSCILKEVLCRDKKSPHHFEIQGLKSASKLPDPNVDSK